jgi:hypothetical protein
VGRRAGLEMVVKRKIPFPCRESNPGRSVRNLVTILTKLLRLTLSGGAHAIKAYLCSFITKRRFQMRSLLLYIPH